MEQNKENKKIEELSDEQLKKVAGGYRSRRECEQDCENKTYPTEPGDPSVEEQKQQCKSNC